MRIDLHTHSAVSDGTQAVPDLVRAARMAGLDAIALTDHDTMAGIDQAQEAGGLIGLEVLRGVEISTHVETGGRHRPVHLLGYGCSPADPVLEAMLAKVRTARRERVPLMVEKLAGLGLPLELAEVQAQAARATSIGRPHVADAMVARGYVADRDEAFRTYLHDGGPAYVERYTPTVAEAVDLVNQARGVAVLAHPWGRGNEAFMTRELIADLARRHGLFGLEADHVDHSEPDRRRLHALADELGLVATGSSDHHGAGKTKNPLGACLTDPAVYGKIKEEIDRRGGQL